MTLHIPSHIFPGLGRVFLCADDSEHEAARVYIIEDIICALTHKKPNLLYYCSIYANVHLGFTPFLP